MPSLFLSMTLRGWYSNFEEVLRHGSTSKVLRMTVRLATTINCANRPPETQIFSYEYYMTFLRWLASLISFNKTNIDIKVITNETI